MSDEAGRAERKSRSRTRAELIATILLALAAVATAWSSYQANRWNGEQAKVASRTNALRIDAAHAQGLAEGQQQADLATFNQWIDGYTTGNTELQEFYATRFRPEFRTAFDAWLATSPFNDSSAPQSPFAMPQYQLAATDEARRLDGEAAVSADIVQRNIQRSSNYVLGVVIFAVALFFAGVSTRPRNPRSQWALLIVGGTLFVGAVAWLATFPITVSV